MIVICIIVSIIGITALFIVHIISRFKHTFSFDIDKKNIGIPVISFTQEDKVYDFIVDTGADASVLAPSALNMIECKEAEGSRNIYGIDGKNIKVSYVDTCLYHKGLLFKERFQVCDVPGINILNKEYNTNIIGILGGTFLRKYKSLIDYKKKNVVIRK